MSEKILRTEYSEEMQKSYLDYSMSVITSRAIPDARDGLKPVQRRVLYDMSELHLDHDKPHRKSARIVGDTMGKYHPHGDSSIYETLVVLSQDFKKGMALVDGHGNFGSIEGDGAAAMRYTEARLKKFAEEVYLKDLLKVHGLRASIVNGKHVDTVSVLELCLFIEDRLDLIDIRVLL
jgi:DNA gyrase subunit A